MAPGSVTARQNIVQLKMSPRANQEDIDWEAKAKGILKAELVRRDMTYGDLTERLCSIGVDEDVRRVSNKISRGTFTAAFFIQCLQAIGCRNIRLGDE